jgi:MFS family permease
MAVLPVFRDDLQHYLNINAERFGLLFSVGPIAGIACVLAGGALVRRLGPLRMIRWCLVGTAAGMAIVAAAGQRYALVLLGCTLCGALSGTLFLAVNVLLTRLFPRDRRRALALNLAVTCGGGIVFPIAAEGLLALARRGGQNAFGSVLRLPLLAVALLLTAGACFFRPQAPPRPAHATRRRKQTFSLPPPVIWLAVLLAIHASVDTAVSTWMPKFLAGPSFAAPLAAPGIVLALFSLAYLVARSTLAMIPETWGHRRLMVLPGILGGGIFLAGLLSRNATLTATAYVVAGLCWSNEYPAMLAAASRTARLQFGQALAVVSVLSGLLNSAMLYGVGQVAGLRGESLMWQTMATLACGFIAVGLGGALWLILWIPKKPAARPTRDPISPPRETRTSIASRSR